MHKLACIFFGVLSFITAFTSHAVNNDTICLNNNHIAYLSSGASFLTIGAISRATSSDWTPTQFHQEKSNIVDGAQYVPLAFPWILKACGVETRSGWGRMATSHATSTIIMAGSVYLAKNHIHTTRPDATDNRSFPSGHTAWSYMGATMISRELSWQSPWYTMGAYTLASAIAQQRIIDCRHNPGDVATGAGIGIVATQLGYYIGDIIFGTRQIENAPASAPHFEHDTHIALYNTFGIPFTKFAMGNTSISLNSFWETSLGIHSAFNSKWGIDANLSVRSTTIFGNFDGTTTFIAPLNSIGLNVAPEFTTQIADKWAITGSVGGGYFHNFTLKSIDKSISAGKGYFTGNATSGLTFAATEHINLSARLGYELSQQKFSISPSNTYNITTNQSLSKITHALTLGLSIQATL